MWWCAYDAGVVQVVHLFSHYSSSHVVSCCGVPCAGCTLTPDDAVTIASALSHATKLQVLICNRASAYLVFVPVHVARIVLGCAWRMLVAGVGLDWQCVSSATRR